MKNNSIKTAPNGKIPAIKVLERKTKKNELKIKKNQKKIFLTIIPGS